MHAVMVAGRKNQAVVIPQIAALGQAICPRASDDHWTALLDVRSIDSIVQQIVLECPLTIPWRCR
jgi:hypothetical protein